MKDKKAYNESFIDADDLTDWINDNSRYIDIISICCQSDMFFVYYWR